MPVEEINISEYIFFVQVLFYTFATPLSHQVLKWVLLTQHGQ